MFENETPQGILSFYFIRHAPPDEGMEHARQAVRDALRYDHIMLILPKFEEATLWVSSCEERAWITLEEIITFKKDDAPAIEGQDYQKIKELGPQKTRELDSDDGMFLSRVETASR